MSKRRAAGSALCILGTALLMFSAARYVDGAMVASRARAEWEAIDAKRAVAVIDAALSRGGPAWGEGLQRGTPVARLVIPSLGLDEIVIEGVGDTELNSAPGHLTGSAIPGEPGNSVVSAHRDRHFHGLDRLLPGDTLMTESSRGRITWIVETRRVVGQRSAALFATAGPALTLTTCWPVRYFGPAPDRLIVTAKLLRFERTA